MKSPSVPLFALAAISPLVFLSMGCLWGGVWVWLAFAYMAGAVVVLDMVVPWVAPNSDDAEFPGSDLLLVCLALGVLLALPMVVWAVADGSGLGLGPRVVLFLAGGLWFGQVGHPAAHELIHRPGRVLVWLGMAVYAGLIFGHHASAHRLVHHRHVATSADPNSARAGEGFYRFLARAWVGSFRAGWRAEQALRRGKGVNPYWAYGLGAAVALSLGYVLAGWPGVLVWAALGFHFGAQVLVSDYVQHYGLVRRATSGKLEAVAQAHSWNTPHLFTSAMMLNASRHSDHHTHPSRAYAALQLDDAMPMLPWPLPLACLLALCPPYWRWRMQPPLARLALAKA
jgi:alkane 1-monooxygenase